MKIETIWRDETQQQLFRRLLDGISYPGRVISLGDILDGSPGWLGVLATFVDKEVALTDLSGLMQPRHWPLLQVQPAAANEADYLLLDGAGACPDGLEPKLGTLEGPDQSATLLLQLEQLGESKKSGLGDSADGHTRLRLSGPGIAGEGHLSLRGLHPDWLQKRQLWNGDFPMGVDLILSDGGRVVCLPRTTRIEVL